MQDLRLLGVSEDGTRFVLQTPDGQTFSLRIDERLHAALRGDRARLGQLQIQIDQELRPREIQARIRAGESAEDIASASGVPVDQVRRFEGPVLLERTVVAQAAQATHVRRVTDAAATPLGALVAERLQNHGVPRDELAWDSWRRDDGKWLVRLSYAQAGREHHATWLFDAAVHTIEPFDDEADWLTDEERAVPEHREPKLFVPRLASVPPVSELLNGPPQEASSDVAGLAQDEGGWDAPDVDLTSVPTPARFPGAMTPAGSPASLKTRSPSRSRSPYAPRGGTGAAPRGRRPPRVRPTRPPSATAWRRASAPPSPAGTRSSSGPASPRTSPQAPRNQPAPQTLLNDHAVRARVPAVIMQFVHASLQ